MAKKKAAVHAFTRDQLASSRRFAAYQDILRSQLPDDGTYTIAECEKVINDFLHPEAQVQQVQETQETKEDE